MSGDDKPLDSGEKERNENEKSTAEASCAPTGKESATAPAGGACARHRHHMPDAEEIRKLIKKYHVAEFLKSNAVLLIAIAAALVTSIFVPFDAQYADYFDWRTLTCLFCTLAVVAAFKNIKFFVWLADCIVRRFKSLRTVIASLIFVTYFGSMIMANDMALVTFLPLGYFVLDSCGDRKHLAFTFIMQNIAANLGGMLTPFGNPQNLYMYSYFNIGAGEFFRIMALPFAAAFVLIAATCFFVKKEKVVVTTARKKTPPVWRMVVYGILFVFSVLIVFRIFPYYWGLLAVFVAVLALDYRALFKVDYGLLLTFCAFFVFSGNMARIDAGGLRLVAHVLRVLRIQRKHGAHRRDQLFLRISYGERSAYFRRDMLSVHQQRAERGASVAIHIGLFRFARRRQFGRFGYPDSLSREPDYAEYVSQAYARGNKEISS